MASAEDVEEEGEEALLAEVVEGQMVLREVADDLEEDAGEVFVLELIVALFNRRLQSRDLWLFDKEVMQVRLVGCKVAERDRRVDKEVLVALLTAIEKVDDALDAW